MTPQPTSPPSQQPQSSPLRTIPGLLLALIIALLLWIVYRQTGAAVLVIAAVVLLWPHRREEWGRKCLLLVALIGFFWIFHQARQVVYPLLAGLLTAYWLDPVVDRLERRRVPRSVGALMALLPALVIGLAFVLFVLPALIGQLGSLVAGIPSVYEAVDARVRPWIARYLPAAEGPLDLRAWLGGAAAHLESIARGVWGGATGISRGVKSVVGFLTMLVLAPILSYYLLADFDSLARWIRDRIPDSRRTQVERHWGVAEGILRSYFRGQVLLSLAIGIVFTAGFLIIGLPYALLLGFLCGALNLIPVLGFWVGTALCVTAAALSGEAGPMLLRLGVVLAVEQVLEGQVLSPRIVGKAVGLNPAMTLVSVLVFGALFGAFGVLIAVPAAGLLRAYMDLPRPSGAGRAEDPEPPIEPGA